MRHLYPITCALCGQEVQAGSPVARFCPDCRKKHDRLVSKERYARDKADGTSAEYVRKRREKRQKQREEDKANDIVHKRETAPDAVLPPADPAALEARFAAAREAGELTYCERMRLTAYPLPCGKRGECKGCKHCPKGASCENDALFSWNNEIFALSGGR